VIYAVKNDFIHIHHPVRWFPLRLSVCLCLCLHPDSYFHHCAPDAYFHPMLFTRTVEDLPEDTHTHTSLTLDEGWV